eukprot:scaffold85440_cov66-Phaeocystis_antarctica.AAC.2
MKSAPRPGKTCTMGGVNHLEVDCGCELGGRAELEAKYQEDLIGSRELVGCCRRKTVRTLGAVVMAGGQTRD